LARRSIPDVSVADDVLAAMSDRLQAPLAIVLGAPGQVARLASQLSGDIVCFQMDLHTAGHLQDELRAAGSAARVATLPDLWDLPAEFRTVIYPAPKGGERGLKLDMVEQAYHILQPRGCLVVHTPYEADQFFPGQLKKCLARSISPLPETTACCGCNARPTAPAAGTR